jgi:hypothetical protein
VLRELKIPPTPGLKVCSFCHGERRRKTREKVAVVLAIGHTLRAQEALGCPYALSGFFEVVHRLFEDGVFVSHDRSMRTRGIFRSPAYCVFSRKLPYQSREVAGCVPG